MIPRLQEILAKPDPALGYINGELRFWLGWAQEVAGDHAAAKESWRQTRSELESFLKEQPENSQLIDDLALTNIGLGDKPAALALAERAMAAAPIEKDALDGPTPLKNATGLRLKSKSIRCSMRYAAIRASKKSSLPSHRNNRANTFRTTSATHSCTAPARSNIRSEIGRAHV